jgi:glucose-1-phosphate cytidylyltransferase
VFDYIGDDDTILERDPLERLADEDQLVAFRHEGFWQPMDTLREKQLLESLWATGKAPWKTWDSNSGINGTSSSPAQRASLAPR